MTRQGVIAFLDANNVPWQTWGRTPDTKSIDDLVDEVMRKEARLAMGPLRGQFPTRFIKTVVVHIFFDVHTRTGRSVERMKLYELKRLADFHWGLRKRHTGSLSEKLREGEDVTAAVFRGFREELALRDNRSSRLFARHDLKGIKDRSPTGSRPEFGASDSYPGLMTHNELQHLEWIMPLHYYKQAYREQERGTQKVLGYFCWFPASLPIEEVRERVPELIG